MLEIKEDRPSYVAFETVAEEDREASVRADRYMTKDVVYAVITPIGSKDRIYREVNSWLTNVAQQVKEERMPAAWAENYRQAYETWRRGEEIPVNGTPIKGWGVISPSTQQNIISANIRTVEDLAVCNDEGLRRVGMGAQELKDKAVTWLKSLSTAGKVTMETSALQVKIRTLETQVTAQQETIKELRLENDALHAQIKQGEKAK